MNRFNFLGTRRFEGRIFVERLFVDTASRTALLAFGLTLLLLGVAASMEQTRVNAEQNAAAQVALDLARVERSTRDLRETAESIGQLADIAQQAADIRRSGGQRAAALAELADHLPADVYLDSINEQPDGYVINGKAQDFETLGVMLEQFTRLSSFTSADLLSSNEATDSQGQAVDFHVLLKKRRS
ncbi:MAG TPA: PilN domain-containing protein [Candidatus Baltobacteraceae bacterium]|jgi:Tfp pilus assembly protein PilN|nr:PilN domain-containing protein [Candidatus Baltobacteraceae bacterium]